MRKLLLLLFALSVGVLGFTGTARAQLSEQTIKVLVLTQDTGVSTAASGLGADRRIYGYTCTDSAAGECALYDVADSTTNVAVANLIGETQVAAGKPETIRFRWPLKLTTGLVGLIENSTGRILVYYR